MLSMQKNESAYIDVGVLGLLILSLMLYQMQFLFPAYAELHIREILYAYLYFRVLVFYKIKVTPLLMAVLFFLLCALLIAMHTWYIAGLGVALAGFKRFVHVAMLAPLATVLLGKNSHLQGMLYLWVAVVFTGVLTVAYQLLGGEMDWLVRNYIAMRGGLIRHKSLMGEPNVGGFAAVILYFVATMLVANIFARLLLVLAASFLVIVCLSKAAMILFLIINAVIFAFAISGENKQSHGFSRSALNLQGIVLGVWFIFLTYHPLTHEYMVASFKTFVGAQSEGPGIAEDFSNRVLHPNLYPGTIGGQILENFKDIFLGQSFSRAGSAATDLGLPLAIIPHNMYLELYLVGGILFLALLILIQWHTIRELSPNGGLGMRLEQLLVIPFVLICLYMMGYPNLYEPVTGTFFWLVVGAACRAKPALRRSHMA